MQIALIQQKYYGTKKLTVEATVIKIEKASENGSK